MSEIEEVHNRINDLELDVYKNTKWRIITQFITIIGLIVSSIMFIIIFENVRTF